MWPSTSVYRWTPSASYLAPYDVWHWRPYMGSAGWESVCKTTWRLWIYAGEIFRSSDWKLAPMLMRISSLICWLSSLGVRLLLDGAGWCKKIFVLVSCTTLSLTSSTESNCIHRNSKNAAVLTVDFCHAISLNFDRPQRVGIASMLNLKSTIKLEQGNLE